MRKQWNNYQKDFEYATGIAFEDACDAVVQLMDLLMDIQGQLRKQKLKTRRRKKTRLSNIKMELVKKWAGKCFESVIWYTSYEIILQEMEEHCYGQPRRTYHVYQKSFPLMQSVYCLMR